MTKHRLCHQVPGKGSCVRAPARGPARLLAPPSPRAGRARPGADRSARPASPAWASSALGRLRDWPPTPAAGGTWLSGLWSQKIFKKKKGRGEPWVPLREGCRQTWGRILSRAPLPAGRGRAGARWDAGPGRGGGREGESVSPCEARSLSGTKSTRLPLPPNAQLLMNLPSNYHGFTRSLQIPAQMASFLPPYFFFFLSCSISLLSRLFSFFFSSSLPFCLPSLPSFSPAVFQLFFTWNFAAAGFFFCLEIQ